MSLLLPDPCDEHCPEGFNHVANRIKLPVGDVQRGFQVVLIGDFSTGEALPERLRSKSAGRKRARRKELGTVRNAYTRRALTDMCRLG